MFPSLLSACAILSVVTPAAFAQADVDGAVVPVVATPAGAPGLAGPVSGPEGADEAPQAVAFPAAGVQRIDEPMFVDDEREVWVRSRTYKAGADPDGFVYVPFFGGDAPRSWPIRFRLEQVIDGGASISLTRGATVERDGRRVVLDRGPVTVLYDIALESAEQLFVIENPRRQGPLVLSIGLTTELKVSAEGRGFRFAGPDGDVTYSGAVAFDEAGQRTDVPAALEGGRIVLTVPASFVESSAGRITVDPLIATFPVNVDPPRIFRRPDVAYDRTNDDFLYAYEEAFSVSDPDVLATRVSDLGAVLGTSAIFVGVSTATEPAVANLNSANACLVVCTREPGGGGPRGIVGRIVNMDTGTTGAGFFVSTDEDNFGADVGGNPSTDPDSVFLVGWSKRFPGGDVRARFRSVAADGTLGTLYALNNAANSIQDEVAIGQSTGDPGTVNFWPVVVRNEDRGSGAVSILGTRWLPNGDDLLESARTIDSFPGSNISQLDVSSGLATPLGASSSLSASYLIAYTRFSGGTTGTTSLTVCRNSTFAGGPYPLGLLEHGPEDSSYLFPRLGTTRNGYVVAYAQRRPSVDLRVRVHLSYLRIVEEGLLGVGESRTLIRDLGLFSSEDLAIATRYDGGFWNSRVSALGFAEIVETVSGFHATIEGATHVANLNNNQLGSQYCSGAENSTGERGFLTVVGNSDVTSTKTVRCSRLPANQFSLLAIGTLPVQIPTVPNSQGTLCIGGEIGRFTNQVAQIDANGEVAFTVDPTMLPGPNAIAPAMAGQRRMFQAWHRDVPPAPGQPGSNFTNAAAVRFR